MWKRAENWTNCCNLTHSDRNHVFVVLFCWLSDNTRLLHLKNNCQKLKKTHLVQQNRHSVCNKHTMNKRPVFIQHVFCERWSSTGRTACTPSRKQRAAPSTLTPAACFCARTWRRAATSSFPRPLTPACWETSCCASSQMYLLPASNASEINHIQKRLCLHNLCVFTVYIYS